MRKVTDARRCRSRRKATRSSSGGLRRLGSLAGAPPDVSRAHLPAGALCRGLPGYCRTPPVSCVVFGFGVSEDGQLVISPPAGVLAPCCAAGNALHCRGGAPHHDSDPMCMPEL